MLSIRKRIGLLLSIVCLVIASNSHAYVVDCAGGELVQDVINAVGSSDTIIIDGVCSNQGVISIRENGIRIQGNGGIGNVATNVIEGRIDIRGAQNIIINGITITNVDGSALTLIDLAHARIFNSVLEVSSAVAPSISAISMISSRMLFLNNTVTATNNSGSSTAITLSSNAVFVSFSGNSYTASASDVANTLAVGSGSIGWVGHTDSLTSNGTTGYAALVRPDGRLSTVSTPAVGPATNFSGNIRVEGGSAILRNVAQTNGEFEVIDNSRIVIEDSNQFSLANSMKARNSSIRITRSNVDSDISMFLNSVTTIEEDSVVDGHIDQSFGSKTVVLNSSYLKSLVCDREEENNFFVDITSEINKTRRCESGWPSNGNDDEDDDEDDD